MQVQKFNRRKFDVNAVQVNPDNMEQVATWCGGEVQETKDGVKFVKVKTHRPQNLRHTQAFANDWVSLSEQGYKVYTNQAFLKHFEEEARDGHRNVFTDTEELRVTNDPVPAEPTQEEKVEEPKPTPREALGFNTPKNIINN